MTVESMEMKGDGGDHGECGSGDEGGDGGDWIRVREVKEDER